MNPFLAPWRQMIIGALHRNRSLIYSRYLQLATVKPSGQPANRTVVFRGFLEETNQLKFITDSRSEKIEQIQQKPQAEACWYFPKTREQFRLSGYLNLVKFDEKNPDLQKFRNIMWQELSDAARLQFAWPYPGQLRVKEKAAFEPPQPDQNQPLETFCLLLLDPFEVDHLELKGTPQNRWLYKRDEQQSWSVQEINP